MSKKSTTANGSEPRSALTRIVSGGQTGVDRAALDAAIVLGIDHGGWCPRGRLAEDGSIPLKYNLLETKATDYAVRTEQNVVDSDGTLILYEGVLQGGTKLTRRLARRHHKPFLIIELNAPLASEIVGDWLETSKIRVLNVAGPRESTKPGIGGRAFQYLERLFRELVGDGRVCSSSN